jgi:hypothetical protein
MQKLSSPLSSLVVSVMENISHENVYFCKNYRVMQPSVGPHFPNLYGRRNDLRKSWCSSTACFCCRHAPRVLVMWKRCLLHQ